MDKIIRNRRYADAIHARLTTILAATAIMLAALTALVVVHMHERWLSASVGQTGSAAAKHNSEMRGTGPKFGRHAASFFE